MPPKPRRSRRGSRNCSKGGRPDQPVASAGCRTPEGRHACMNDSMCLVISVRMLLISRFNKAAIAADDTEGSRSSFVKSSDPIRKNCSGFICHRQCSATVSCMVPHCIIMVAAISLALSLSTGTLIRMFLPEAMLMLAIISTSLQADDSSRNQASPSYSAICSCGPCTSPHDVHLQLLTMTH